MPQQTPPSSISNLSSEELALVIERLEKLAPMSARLNRLMPTKANIVRAFREQNVTHETLKYGFHIEGLTLLQRCALFTWFNGYLCEEEKLLMPLCILPDGLGWSSDESYWFVRSIAPTKADDNLIDSAEEIAEKIWYSMEMVRDDDVLCDKLPSEILECEDFEALKAKVRQRCVDFTVESSDPQELLQVLEQNGFFSDWDDVTARALKHKILSSNLGFDAVKYGLPRPGGLSYQERLRIYAFFKKYSTASMLVCPLLEAPPDLDCLNLFCHLAFNHPLDSNVTAPKVYHSLFHFLRHVGSVLKYSEISPDESIPAFVKIENGRQDISSFFEHVKDEFGPSLVEGARDLIEAAFMIEANDSRSEHVTNRYVDFIHSMVFGEDPNVERVVDQMNKYFACYSYLGQSSCCGKTKLAFSKKINKDSNRAVLNLYMNAHYVASSNLMYPEPGANSQDFFELLSKVSTYREMECILGRLLIWMRDKFLERHGNFYVLRGGYSPRGYTVDDDTLKFNVTGIINGFEHYSNQTFHVWKDELNYLTSIYVDATKQVRVLFSVNIDEAARLVDTLVLKLLDERDFAQALTDSGAAYHKSLPSKNISVFRLMRRILYFRKSEFWYCPFIFSDTNTRLGNFIPALSREASLRIGFSSVEFDVTPFNYILFKPFLLYDTWNLFLELYEDPINQQNWLKYIESLEFFKNLGYVGRPIWGAMIKAAIENNCPLNEAMEWVLSMAKAKVVFDFGRIPNIGSEEYFEAKCAAMAVMGTTIGLNSIDSVVHSENAVKRWMAILTYYSSKSSSICVRYFSEPMLAIAACSLLRMHPKRIMEEFRNCMGNSYVNVGESGEFVARLLVLLCFLSCKLSDRYANNLFFDEKKKPLYNNVAPRNVLDFLKMLTGPDIEKRIDAAVLAHFGRRTSSRLAQKRKIDVEEPVSKGKEEIEEIEGEFNEIESNAVMGVDETEENDTAEQMKEAEKKEEVIAMRKIQNGYVSFSHYLMTHVIVKNPQENLAFAMAHQAALNLPANSDGVDFVIPVALLDGSLGSINVQVKNQIDMASNEEFKVWNAKVCSRDIPSINILMNVYPNLDSTADPEPEQSSLDVKFVRCRGRNILTITIVGTALPNFHGLCHDPATGMPFSEDSPYHDIIHEAAMLARSQIAYYDPHSSKREESREEFFVEQNNLERARRWYEPKQF